VIDTILADDRVTSIRPRRQRHTGKRIFEWLRAEHCYTGGYTIVQGYVRELKVSGQEMFAPLTHAPGEAQADFARISRAIRAAARQSLLASVIEIWIGRFVGKGSWLLSVSHAGVAAELDLPRIDSPLGPWFAMYAFTTLGELYRTLERVYKLGVSLPDAPLEAFKKATAHLPQTTEVERLTVERVGQSLFRQALLEYWNAHCPLTGITDPALLRASHIVPWAECESDAFRLDVHNGLLLSALWDAAFDAGLISFADDGTVLRSPNLTAEAAAALNLDSATRLPG
jgi:hypothetical protein